MGRVFLLGKPTSMEQKKKIKIESLQFGDIVQGNYDDDMAALKTLNGIFWLAKNCVMVSGQQNVDRKGLEFSVLPIVILNMRASVHCLSKNFCKTKRIKQCVIKTI